MTMTLPLALSFLLLPQAAAVDAGTKATRLQGRKPNACSIPGDDCRDTQCCTVPAMKCYKKNSHWGSCLESCAKGETNPHDPPEHKDPWDCTLISTKTPTTTVSVGPGPTSTTTIKGPRPTTTVS